MKFITVRDLRTSPAKVWSELPEEQEMVITNHGKPIALLTPLSDETLEQSLTTVRRARAMQAFEQIQKLADERGLSKMSEAEIDAEIRAVRAERKR